MKKLYLLPLLLLFAFLGCKKDDDLPEAVRGGPNMFACKVNGKIFVAQDEVSLSGRSRAIDGGMSTFPGKYGRQKAFILLIRGGGSSFKVYFDSLEGPKLYLLNQDVIMPEGYYLYPENDYLEFGVDYRTSSKSTGWIDFSVLEKKKNETMGTFDFNAEDSKGRTVKITDGRFYFQARP